MDLMCYAYTKEQGDRNNQRFLSVLWKGCAVASCCHRLNSLYPSDDYTTSKLRQPIRRRNRMGCLFVK